MPVLSTRRDFTLPAGGAHDPENFGY